jgi:hypothetical protein
MPTTQVPVKEVIITARVALNVRSGPDVEYAVIGKLSEGESTWITGKNPEGTWWQIVYPPDSGGQGWVSASAELIEAMNEIPNAQEQDIEQLVSDLLNNPLPGPGIAGGPGGSSEGMNEVVTGPPRLREAAL